MTSTIIQIANLICKQLQEPLTSTEQQELNAWLDASLRNRALYNEINDPEQVSAALQKFSGYNDERLQELIASEIQKFPVSLNSAGNYLNSQDDLNPTGDHLSSTGGGRTISRPVFLRMKYAAAIFIIILGIAVYYIIKTDKEKPGIVQASLGDVQKAKQDIPPGGQRAVLTLADGSTINLDSAANGQLTTQGNASVIKTSDGRLTYQMSSGPSNSVRAGSGTGPSYPPLAGVSRSDGGGQSTNKMTTPIGGQYQLTLPDGTKVWLNASSSITYPVSFGKQRNVTLTGEAYFEIAKDKSRPFIVKTSQQEITVLGTSFNINAYPDEPLQKTSLIDGSIKINSAFAKASADEAVLKPGQAFINNKITITNTSQDIAWKNGIFNFQDKSLHEVMRQLSRWYGIEINYSPGVKEKEFGGELPMKLNLSQVLKLLQGAGLHFEIRNNKTLLVLP